MLRIILFLAGSIYLAGCSLSGDVEFVADPVVNTPPSVQVQVVQGANTQMTAAGGYTAKATLQSVESKELTGNGYRAIVQPVIRR